MPTDGGGYGGYGYPVKALLSESSAASTESRCVCSTIRAACTAGWEWAACMAGMVGWGWVDMGACWRGKPFGFWREDRSADTAIYRPRRLQGLWGHVRALSLL